MATEKKEKLLLTADERISKGFYTFKDLNDKIDYWKKQSKKPTIGLIVGIILALFAVAINFALVLQSKSIDDNMGLLFLSFIPVEIYYLVIVSVFHEWDDYGKPGIFYNFLVLIGAGFLAVGLPTFAKWNWRASVSISIFADLLVVYKTILVVAICYNNGPDWLSVYKGWLKIITAKKGTLTYDEYDEQILAKVQEYNNAINAKLFYQKAMESTSAEDIFSNFKLSAEYGDIEAQKILKEYKEFMEAVSGENPNYIELIAYSQNKPLSLIMQDYLKNCTISATCDSANLQALKQFGNTNATLIIKTRSDEEYKKYKLRKKDDLNLLEKIADDGSCEACAEYALKKYVEIINGSYTKTESDDLKSALLDKCNNGKNSKNEVYKISCSVLSIELTHQLWKRHELSDLKKDLAMLRMLKLDDKYDDVFSINVKSIVEELIKHLISDIDSIEHPVVTYTPSTSFVNTDTIAKKVAAEIEKRESELTRIGAEMDVSDIM